MGVHSAAAVVVLALVVGAVAEGDSLADLGGAAREIEGAPGTPRRGDLSLSGFVLLVSLVGVCRVE
jgi:hypothetical protein